MLDSYSARKCATHRPYRGYFGSARNRCGLPITIRFTLGRVIETFSRTDWSCPHVSIHFVPLGNEKSHTPSKPSRLLGQRWTNHPQTGLQNDSMML